MLEILEYPFDVSKILRKKIALKKILLEKKNLIDIKIAVLGATTTFEIIDQLELFLLKAGFKPNFYSCEYSQHYNVVMFDEKELINFKPDIVYLHVSTECIDEIDNHDKSSKEKAEVEFNKLQKVWKKLNKNLNCSIVQDNFEFPVVRSLGNFSFTSTTGSSYALSLIHI